MAALRARKAVVAMLLRWQLLPALSCPRAKGKFVLLLSSLLPPLGRRTARGTCALTPHTSKLVAKLMEARLALARLVSTRVPRATHTAVLTLPRFGR